MTNPGPVRDVVGALVLGIFIGFMACTAFMQANYNTAPSCASKEAK